MQESYCKRGTFVELTDWCPLVQTGAMHLFSRIQDAVKAAWAVLWGRSEQARQMADIRREWAECLIDIDVMFDKMNSLVARLAKRQKRELDQAEVELELAPPTVPSYSDRKLDLRRRIAAKRSPKQRHGGE